MVDKTQRFIALRKSLGKSKTDFGKLLGFNHPYKRVWEVEKGIKPVSRQIEMILGFLEKDQKSPDLNQA